MSFSIQALAAEGKQITKIMAEDFPEYEYIEIYEATSDSSWKTTQGVKRAITKRLTHSHQHAKSQNGLKS